MATLRLLANVYSKVVFFYYSKVVCISTLQSHITAHLESIVYRR